MRINTTSLIYEIIKNQKNINAAIAMLKINDIDIDATQPYYRCNNRETLTEIARVTGKEIEIFDMFNNTERMLFLNMGPLTLTYTEQINELDQDER